jgi:hypothetical protein
MSIEWIRETSAEIEYSGESQGPRRATRSWLFKVTTPDVSPALISTSIPVAFNEPHPQVAGIRARKFRVRPSDSTGMLWSAVVEYETAPDAESPDNPTSNGLPGRPPVWSGSSSVTTGPVYKQRSNATDATRNGPMMTNSAGDPLEDLTAEFAEERLTLTGYYASHTDWMADSKLFTNCCNSDTWNGGGPYTWKCQGCSKKLNAETAENGATLIYWEVTWEFAYRAEGWQLRPWDIGFAEKVDDEGVPSGSGTKRRTIRGQDGKGVRQPVALNNGIAKEAGEPPDALEFYVYAERPFVPQFGEVYTPRA